MWDAFIVRFFGFPTILIATKHRQKATKETKTNAQGLDQLRVKNNMSCWGTMVNSNTNNTFFTTFILSIKTSDYYMYHDTTHQYSPLSMNIV
ncbi:MAG: hypothetical protein SOU88_02525 [Candidatus Treponema excrementipullorum]|nr:hypothetical protein [Candidatus Treponema excrementipullorum]